MVFLFAVCEWGILLGQQEPGGGARVEGRAASGDEVKLETVTLFDNSNPETVRNDPTASTSFSLTRSVRVTYLRTYHYNGGQGAKPGTLELRDEQGRTYGPFETRGTGRGKGDLPTMWYCEPDLLLPPGKYTIIDSDPATWSHNPQSGLAGIAWVSGVVLPPEGQDSEPGESMPPGAEPVEPQSAPGGEAEAGQPVGPPPWDFKLRELRTVQLKPSLEPQTVTVDRQVTVIVPGATLREPTPLRISAVDNPLPAPGNAEVLATFDISLGDLHQFEQEIEIVLPYNPAAVESDLPPELAVLAGYQDELSGDWVQLPCVLESAARQIRIRTRHLSRIAAWYLGKNYRAADCQDARGNVVATVYFSDSELKRARPLSLDWELKSGSGQLRNDRKGQPVPSFIEDACLAAETAIGKYESINRPLKSRPLSILIHGTGDSEHRWERSLVFWGDYLVFVTTTAPIDATTGPIHADQYDRLQYTMAHEIFHNCQMSDFSVEQNLDHRWWMEVTAEYAASRLVMPDYQDMGKLIDIDRESMSNFFNVDLTSAPKYSGHLPKQQFHSYHSTYFLEYLIKMTSLTDQTAIGQAPSVDQKFSELYNFVKGNMPPALPRRIRDGDALYRLDLYDSTPTEDIRLLPVLDQFVARSGWRLSELYAAFAAHYLLGQNSPFHLRFSQKNVPDYLATYRTALPLVDQTVEQTFQLMPNGTAQLWAVRKEPGSPLAVTCSLVGGLPKDVEIWTLVLPKNERISGSLKEQWQRHERILPKVPTRYCLNDDDVLYVLAAQTSGRQQSVTVRIQGKVEQRIDPQDLIAKFANDYGGLGRFEQAPEQATLTSPQPAGKLGQIWQSSGSWQDFLPIQALTEANPNKVLQAGPFDVGPGKLKLFRKSKPPYDHSWIHGHNTLVGVQFQPQLGTGWGPVEALSIDDGSEPDSEGSATIPAAGRILITVSPCQGSGNWSWQFYKQEWSAALALVELSNASRASIGTAIQPGDRVRIDSSREPTIIRLPDGRYLIPAPGSEFSLRNDQPGQIAIDFHHGSGRLTEQAGAQDPPICPSTSSRVEFKLKLGKQVFSPEGTDVVFSWDGSSGNLTVVAGAGSVTSLEGSQVQRLDAGQRIDLATGEVQDASTEVERLRLESPLQDFVGDNSPEAYGEKVSPGLTGDSQQPGDSGWHWVDPGQDARFRLAGEGLHLEVPEGNSFLNQEVTAPRLLHKVTGDFDLEATVHVPRGITDTATVTPLIFTPGGGLGYRERQVEPAGAAANYFRFEPILAEQAGRSRLAVFAVSPFSGMESSCEAPDEPVWVRFQRRGQTWKIAWSIDGQRWNLAARQIISAPETLYVGWAFSHIGNNARPGEPAAFSLGATKLVTAPSGSLPVIDWDSVDYLGQPFVAQNGQVTLALDQSRPGQVRAFSGEVLEQEADFTFTLERGQWPVAADAHYLTRLGLQVDVDNRVYLQITQGNGETKWEAPSLWIEGNSAPGETLYPDELGSQWRFVRKAEQVVIFRWANHQWSELARFDAKLAGPIFPFVELENACDGATPQSVAVKVRLQNNQPADRSASPPILQSSAMQAEAVSGLTVARLELARQKIAQRRQQPEPERPPGWKKSWLEPGEVLAEFPQLRMREGFVLRAYLHREDGNGSGVVWAMPADAEYPEPKDCPILEHHFLQAPKPFEALDDTMEGIEGDGSADSYLAASMLRRELMEFGAVWHGLDWATHQVLSESPFNPGKQQSPDPRPATLDPKPQWSWRGEEPADYQPQVVFDQDRVQVTFYTYTAKAGVDADGNPLAERIMRHTDTYQRGKYRLRSRETVIAVGKRWVQF